MKHHNIGDEPAPMSPEELREVLGDNRRITVESFLDQLLRYASEEGSS